MQQPNVNNKITTFLDRKVRQYPELNKPIDTLIREWK